MPKDIGRPVGVYSVAILGPDRIVSGSGTRLKIWNTDGECLKTLEGHSDCKFCGHLGSRPNR